MNTTPIPKNLHKILKIVVIKQYVLNWAKMSLTTNKDSTRKIISDKKTRA